MVGAGAHQNRSSRRRSAMWPAVWRRRPLGTAAIFVLAILLIWVRCQIPADSDYDRYHNKVFTCVRVVDGDTIDVDIPDGQHRETRIRLWGVDTPETAKSPQGEMYFGREASAFTKSLVENKTVRLVLVADKTRGKYGRLLAYVYLADSDTMLNEELIAQGFGYADRRFSHPWKERFNKLEAQARKQKRGLWPNVDVQQLPPWRQRYEKWLRSTTQSAK